MHTFIQSREGRTRFVQLSSETFTISFLILCSTCGSNILVLVSVKSGGRSPALAWQVMPSAATRAQLCPGQAYNNLTSHQSDLKTQKANFQQNPEVLQVRW